MDDRQEAASRLALGEDKEEGGLAMAAPRRLWMIFCASTATLPLQVSAATMSATIQ